MKYIYVFFALMMFGLASCGSNDSKQPAELKEHAVNPPDSMPRDNTSVADSVNGNPNVGMGGGN
jgi:hypothetical protein